MPAGRLDGVSLAGFRHRSAGTIDVPVVPYPAVTVILEFGNGSLTVDGGAGRRHQGSLVTGLSADAMQMRGVGIECVEVRLSPVVAHRVIGVSLADLADGVVPVDAVWGREAERIREQLNGAPSWEHRFAITEALLARRSRPGHFVDREVAWTWGQLVATRGGARIEDLATEIGWSRKRLWSRFRSQIGLPPKSAARLVRFNHAAQRLAAGQAAASVAADCGYVDQSHLHREIVAFTGVTPAFLAGDPALALEGP